MGNAQTAGKTAQDWKKTLAAMQKVTHYVIDGQPIQRRKEHLTNDYTCHDCGASRFQYHVLGCDNEICPNCLEQAFGCECNVTGIVIEGATDAEQKLIARLA